MNEEILNALLRDRTTGKNILWANAEFGAKEITAAQVDSICPRHEKIREQQKQRTRDRAEIFTPPDICALQNDLIWMPRKRWTEYVDAKFLEITCGEAPYLVSRYNAVTGEAIQLDNRVGLLDRKLRLVSMETKTLPDWTTWTLRAVESVYGYEFQGDNLFLARRNVFDTVVENFAAKFDCKPPKNFWLAVATIISCNLWQMDGKTNAIPYYEPPPEKSKSKPKENPNQTALWQEYKTPIEQKSEPPNVYCKILDWRTGKVVEFGSLAKGAQK